jgi:type III secretion protein F
MSGVSGFNYNQISSTMGQSTSAVENQLSSFSQSMDPGNASDMIKMQQLTQQWSLAINLQSTTMKLISDTLKGVVQKIG